MSESKVLQGTRQALAFSQGDMPAARLTINGHSYVPEVALPPEPVAVANLLRLIVDCSAASNRSVDQMVRDLDRIQEHAKAGLRLIAR